MQVQTQKIGGGVPTSSDTTWDAVKCNFDADGYRLPTEAEWEYFARGKENKTYSGSDNVEDVAWILENSEKKTHEVEQKQSNAFGLYDMSGVGIGLKNLLLQTLLQLVLTQVLTVFYAVVLGFRTINMRLFLSVCVNPQKIALPLLVFVLCAPSNRKIIFFHSKKFFLGCCVLHGNFFFYVVVCKNTPPCI